MTILLFTGVWRYVLSVFKNCLIWFEQTIKNTKRDNERWKKCSWQKVEAATAPIKSRHPTSLGMSESLWNLCTWQVVGLDCLVFKPLQISTQNQHNYRHSRDQTWKYLSVELGTIGRKCWWPINIGSFIWPQIGIMFGCMYPFFLKAMREGKYRTQLLMLLGVTFGTMLVMFIYYRLVISRLKALSIQIDAAVSKFQGTVASEGYFLEFLTSRHNIRSYEVRFRPTVSGGSTQPMPVAEKDTKVVQAEIFGEILLFPIGTTILSHLLFNSE